MALIVGIPFVLTEAVVVTNSQSLAVEFDFELGSLEGAVGPSGVQTFTRVICLFDEVGEYDGGHIGFTTDVALCSPARVGSK